VLALEHAELALLFGMITPVPWLERNPTYKEQREQLTDRDLSTYGFLGYPVLQAADILIVRAGLVPVGQDQKQHVEVTRDVAEKFGHDYFAEQTRSGKVRVDEFPPRMNQDGIGRLVDQPAVAVLAVSQRLFGSAPVGRIDHDAAEALRRSVLVERDLHTIAEPDRPAVGRDDAVFERMGTSCANRSSVLWPRDRRIASS
jgi:tryptophanyl-tRNA synthetase